MTKRHSYKKDYLELREKYEELLKGIVDLVSALRDDDCLTTLEKNFVLGRIQNKFYDIVNFGSETGIKDGDQDGDN